MDCAVDLRCVSFAAAFGSGRADLVDDDLLTGADVALEAACRDRLLALHEAVPALLLDLIRHGLAEIVGRRVLYGLIAEPADPVEPRSTEPVGQERKCPYGRAPGA